MSNNNVSITHKETATSFSISFHFMVDGGSFSQTFYLASSPTTIMHRNLMVYIDKIFNAQTTDWLKLTNEDLVGSVLCKFEIKTDCAVFCIKECDKYGLEIRQCSMNMYDMVQFDQLYAFLNDLKFNWLVRSK